ncbi:MAG TPA: M14-type cytosolic carboxypeptidase [Planctomycetota bacterium]|nr:M14-type cytosolic carboxypeptidase [Planctomycetota bacterium]
MKALALLVLPLAACSSSAISVTSDFEGGSLGKVQQVSATHFRCAVAGQADQDGRNRQASWYSFRLDGAKGREVTITLTELRGEYNYKPAGLCVRDDTPPLVSADGKTWRHLESISLEKDEATFRLTAESDAVWIAHLEPYPTSRLERFLDEIRGAPHLKDEVIGKSVEGRDLHLLTITEFAAESAAPPPTVWLMCRQHAWESGTSFVGEGAIRFLLSEDAAPLRRSLVFKILPMMDPDGCARGGVRFNRHGYDLNRNWDTADPENPEHRRLMPEICAAKKVIHAFSGFFLTLHNQETGEWLSSSEKNRPIAERFFAALKEQTTFNPNEKGPRAPSAKPTPGRASVYEYLDGQRGMSAFLLEQGITRSSKLGHLPTSQDRLEFGRQLIRVMADVAMGK